MEDSLVDCKLICRGCLAQSGEMKNMYEWGLTEDFAKLTETQMQKIEGLSEMLCISCEDALVAYKRFKNQCQQSDMFLKEIVKKKLSTGSDAVGCINRVINTLKDNKLIINIMAPDMNSKISLTCPFGCTKNCLRKTDLLIHMIKMHQYSKDFLIELRYNCTFSGCSYSHDTKRKWFSGRKFLNQHYNKVHREKIYQCATCKSDFSTNSAYMRHLRQCNLNYPCHICDMQYSTYEKYLVHLLRRHPEYHTKYKMDRQVQKRKLKYENEIKQAKTKSERISEYLCDSPKRTFATQTLHPSDSIKNDVSLSPWPNVVRSGFKTDEISTQTVFEDLLSLKSQNSEDESIFFSETVSLSDIHTQTFPLEFGLSRSNKETLTSETQSPDLSMKETQTCVCLCDSPKLSSKLSNSVSASPSSLSLTSSETQTGESRHNVMSDVLLSFSSTETQTCFNENSKNM